MPSGDYSVVVGYSDRLNIVNTTGCVLEGVSAAVSDIADKVVPAGYTMETRALEVTVNDNFV